MAENVGVVFKVEGEKEYREALKNIQQEQKLLNAELKKASAEFKANGNQQEFNRKKAELLNRSVELQKQKIQETEKVLKQLKNTTSANADEQAKIDSKTKQYTESLIKQQTELIKLEADLKNIKVANSNFVATVTEVGNKLENIGGKISSFGESTKKFGDTLTKNVTVPLLAIGGASLKAFSTFDDALDTIIKKTGATGDTLSGFETILKNVGQNSTFNYGDIGTAIGELNTRFDINGKKLEDLTTKYLRFADINNTDVNSSIDDTQKIMTAFNLSVDEVGALLDTLTVSGQKSGIEISKLTSSLITNGASLRQMGLSASDSISFLAGVEKSGADVQQVMSGLQRALANATAKGIPFSKALSDVQNSIKNAKTETDGLNVAYELFGNRAGGQIYDAIKNNTLAFDELGTSLNENIGAVDKTFEATLDPIDEFKISLNNLITAGAELGSTISESLKPILETFTEVVKNVTTWFSGLDSGTKQTIVTIGLFVLAIGPAIAIVGSLITTIGTIVSGVGAFIGVLGALLSPIGLVVLGIGSVIAIGVALYKNWDLLKEKASDLGSWVAGVFEGLKNKVSEIFNGIASFIKGAIDRIKGFFNFSWELPKIKLPHFSISGGFSLIPPRAPSFNVEWYGKAYNQAYGFSSPTVMATPSGLKGFGDGVGTEIVIGQNKLLSTIMDAVNLAMSKSSNNLNYGGTTINVYGSENQSTTELANKVATIINNNIHRMKGAFK